MRRFLATLCALVYLAAATSAHAGFLIDPYTNFPAGGAPATPVVTFLQCASDTSDLTTYTFAAQNVGTASGTRSTIVGVLGADSASVFGVSTVTVNGSSATEIVDEDGTGNVDSAIYIISNPLGTSHDVVVTFSEAITAAAICMWAVTDLSSLTAVASTPDDDAAGGVVVLNLNTSADGISVGVCATTGNTNATTWVGFTERNDTAGTQIAMTAADFTEDASAATPLTVSCDSTLAANATGVSASFR